MELSLVALDTGKRVRCAPSGVDDEVLGEVRDWLLDAVWSQRVDALPSRWTGFRANATDFGGGLVLTVYGTGDGVMPVLTVGVARRASHGSPLWRVLTALPRAMQGLAEPRTPWCGRLEHREDVGCVGLGDFVEACAWVWVQRPLPARRGVGRGVGRVFSSSSAS